MPFTSTAQKKWMFANKPEMAHEWAAHTPKDKKLPEHVAKKASYLRGTEAAFEKLGISLRKVRSVAERTGEGIRDKVHGFPLAVTERSFRKRMYDAENYIRDRSFKHTKRGLELENTRQSDKHHALAEGLWKGFKGLDPD